MFDCHCCSPVLTAALCSLLSYCYLLSAALPASHTAVVTGLDSDASKRTDWISDPANAIVSPAVKAMLGCNHGPESDEEGSSRNPIGSSGLLAVARSLWDAADEKCLLTLHTETLSHLTLPH